MVEVRETLRPERGMGVLAIEVLIEKKYWLSLLAYQEFP